MIRLITPFWLLILMLISTGITAQPSVSSDLNTTDSTIHYYVNGKISVIRTPWKEGWRETKLYNLKGDHTYTIKEARLSFQISADISFHSNGAVKSASVFMNPGASQYMHNSTIEFSTTNNPQWRVDKKTPVVALDDAAGEKYYWHKKKERWEKQEIVSCNPKREK